MSLPDERARQKRLESQRKAGTMRERLPDAVGHTWARPGGSGSAMRFGIITSVGEYPDNADQIFGRFLKYDADADLGFSPDGDIQEWHGWPNCTSPYYEAFIVADSTGDTITAKDTVLPVVNVGGRWYVMIVPRPRTGKPTGTWEPSSCY